MSPDREALVTFLAIVGMSGILLGLLMMVGTTIYLNRSPRRFRLFELGYSRNSEWYKSGKVDFFTANYIMSHMLVAALRMRGGAGAERVRSAGSPLAPCIHLDRNYDKFLNEFPGFVRCELIKFFVIVISIALVATGMGLEKGWW